MQCKEKISNDQKGATCIFSLEREKLEFNIRCWDRATLKVQV